MKDAVDSGATRSAEVVVATEPGTHVGPPVRNRRKRCGLQINVGSDRSLQIPILQLI